MIRVLVAEDSVTTRELLVAIFRSHPDVRVVGEAKNGVEALELTQRLRPDVITMDIHMPLMDGFETTRQIMAETPTPIVIVSAGIGTREIEISMHALRAGALTVLPKPPGPQAPDYAEQARRFVDTIRAMAQVKVVRRWHARAPVRGTPRARGPLEVVAIATSTGGPAALVQILSGLPADFTLPILIVQHIARGFTDGFVTWLNTASPIRVKLAEAGEPLRARTAYVAREDVHLCVGDRTTVAVSTAPAIDGFRPSATVLFESVARVFGASSIAIILTGMGRDGVVGLREVHKAGGVILAQDEQSSVVFGMPGAAIEEGLADAIVPLDAIASRVRALVTSGQEEER